MQTNPVARAIKLQQHRSRESAEWKDSRRVVGASRQKIGLVTYFVEGRTSPAITETDKEE